MIFVETTIFTKRLKELMSEDEYRKFQQYLANTPNAGKIIKGSGGLRKVRWGMQTHGKSGGVRIIYYYVQPDSHIRLLLIYPKNEQDSLTDKQLKLLRDIVERW
ncbi:hypothetical protein Q3O60_08740 [Alkalimonas collagenimarina]|uniref:Type II toxin-antitoxin system RelE/ParE family toxin n=1 Tax=Alkalimonas collagenimarina TaxID=400390 RepID=A0ABT9GZ94_9GAMM|nr:hypothetical protein [Alkalimonas collagenimarina]MDP4536273.1 hypothetical protein [Alkalimonas collagenimarina]